MNKIVYILILPYDSDLQMIPVNINDTVVSFSYEKPFFVLGCFQYDNLGGQNYLRINEQKMYFINVPNTLINTAGGGTIDNTINFLKRFGKGDYIQPGSYELEVYYS